ncbi:MAG: hypothetical protein R6X08_04840, partial [Desulfosalsimonadaceae bacterium]
SPTIQNNSRKRKGADHKMREKNQKQLPLMQSAIDHPQADELMRISRILDKNPIIGQLAMQDLKANSTKTRSGAKGMSADQVIFCTQICTQLKLKHKKGAMDAP